MNFYQEGADDVARTGTHLNSVRKFLGFPTGALEAFLKLENGYGLSTVPPDTTMDEETNMRTILKAPVCQSRADG